MTRNDGHRPNTRERPIRVRYVNGETSEPRPASWWTNWKRSDDAFAIDAWAESATIQAGSVK